ncbi:YncE family protein [Aeoliella mucimassa]|uniref:Uncharacterized protein n=1 Tax=Aeoliella mucimassa TaxID=2527972 RepID=A0A518AHB0_9BACT|nr:hypothetical protein [Aeoliella mucimassa]QDU54102.1 hypothetical protein Pan181_02820 [Aeoliella mucimassa]
MKSPSTLLLAVSMFALMSAGSAVQGATEIPILLPDRLVATELPVHDLAYDPVRQQLYASVPRDATSPYANTLTSIDVATGNVSNSYFLGNRPTELAIADNGQYLYANLFDDQETVQFDVASGTIRDRYDPFPSSTSRILAEDLEVMPGDPNTVAAALYAPGSSPSAVGVAVWSNGVRLPNVTSGHSSGANRIEFGETPNTLYGFHHDSTGFGFITMNVDETGATITQVDQGLIYGFGVDIEYAAGRVIASTGQVVDTATHTSAGRLPMGGNLVAYGDYAYVPNGQYIDVFDLESLEQVASLLLARRPRYGNAESVYLAGPNRLAIVTDQDYVLIATTGLAPVPEPHALALLAPAALMLWQLRRSRRGVRTRLG